MGQNRPLSEMEGGKFYHGSHADLPVGAILTPGRNPNFNESDHTRVSITSDSVRAWTWANSAAARAKREHIFVYEVEPLGDFEVWRCGPSNQGRNFVVFEARVSGARIVARAPVKLPLLPGAPIAAV